jgi:hypothetical protein
LGATPDAVARRLSAYGVAGVPGKAEDCPMARYLKAVIGSEPCVSGVVVLERRLQVKRGRLRLPVSLTLPSAIAGFVRGFDEGQYPRLVADLAGGAASAPSTGAIPAGSDPAGVARQDPGDQ